MNEHLTEDELREVHEGIERELLGSSPATTASRRIDISDELEALLQKLGFPDKTVVAEARVGVRDATVLYYPLNEDGYKHVGDDGYPVTRWRTIRVTT